MSHASPWRKYEKGEEEWKTIECFRCDKMKWLVGSRGNLWHHNERDGGRVG